MVCTDMTSHQACTRINQLATQLASSFGVWMLGKNLETNNAYRRAVSKQRLGKHVPAETNTYAIIERRFRWGPRRGVRKQDNWSNPLQLRISSWVEPWREGATVEFTKSSPRGGYDIRTWEREVEESPLLEDVARERLVKTQEAGKDLASAAVIFKDFRLATAL
jgi:hypothetical protein